jgi:HK97 family phage prohead protease
MKHLAFPCEIKLATSGDDTAVGTVEGYGSVFGLLDRGGDIVDPGAFKASLADWRKKGATPPMLWQHDPYTPIGVWSDLAEDEKGLKVTGELIMEVPQAAVARALIKAGAVKGLSIGYETKDSLIDRATGARHLKKVDLWEISPVTFAMLPEAQISGVKASDFDPGQWERAFRDEGLSIREAKAAVAAVRKQALRDAGRSEPTARDGMADVLMSLRKLTELARV